MTDITFNVPEGIFNLRTAAVIINEGKLLVMRDEGISHLYLPGGRIQWGETANQGIYRELYEELNIKNARIIRPLWLNQSFFSNRGNNFHELCFYFLIGISETDLLARGESFEIIENNEKHNFSWIAFDKLANEEFYPLFLKKEIFNLPEQFTLRTEIEIEENNQITT